VVPQLENLLPTGVWHNSYTAGVSNVMLHSDFWLLPLNGILMYGEFLLDDGKAPDEPSGTKPTSGAWEIGAKLAFPVRFGAWRFSLSPEYSHVDEWTYNRWQPYLTMYQRQLITGGSRGFDIPLGHPEGGDVDQFSLRLSALTRKGHSIEAGYSFILKGPVYLGMIEKNDSTEGPAYIPVYYDYDAIVGRDRALTALLGNTRKGTHAFSLDVSWPLTSRCEFEGGIDVRYVQNAGHISGRISIERIWNLGCRWSWGE